MRKEPAVETMPADAGMYIWECPASHAVVQPKPGDCCVFRSYGAQPCQFSQQAP